MMAPTEERVVQPPATSSADTYRRFLRAAHGSLCCGNMPGLWQANADASLVLLIARDFAHSPWSRLPTTPLISRLRVPFSTRQAH